MATLNSAPPGWTAKGFTVAGNTLSRQVSADPKRLFRVEIGDARDTTQFLPHAKVSGWNECDFAIKIPMLPGARCAWVGDVLSYANNTYDVRFWEQVDEHGHEELEYEVTFLRKPGVNTWAFDLEMNDVVAYFQPPLTPAELTETDAEGNLVHGYTRPSSPGSYAIYKASPFKNVTGGTIYQMGKVTHIWRPQIFDRDGNWVWCDMVLDSTAKTLTVTIPPTFFNTAPLPWRLDPTLGYSSGSGTPSYSYSIENACCGALLTPSEDGTVDSIHGYFSATTIAKNAKMNIYNNSSPSNPITNGVTSEFSIGTSGWQYYQQNYSSKPSITNGTAIICVGFSASGSGVGSIGRDNGTSTQRNVTGTYSTFPTNVTWSTQAYNPWIYITYTAGGNRTGTASITLAATTLSSTGTVKVVGSLASTLADLTLSSTTGAVLVKGTGSITLADLLLTAAGGAVSAISGTLAVTLADTTVVASGGVKVQGVSGITLDPLSPSSSGKVYVKGAGTITLADFTPSSSGKVWVRGGSTITLGDLLTSNTTGKVLVAGNAVISLDSLITSLSGKVLIQGAASIPLGDLVLTARGGAPAAADEIILLLSGRICKKITDQIYIML